MQERFLDENVGLHNQGHESALGCAIPLLELFGDGFEKAPFLNPGLDPARIVGSDSHADIQKLQALRNEDQTVPGRVRLQPGPLCLVHGLF